MRIATHRDGRRVQNGVVHSDQALVHHGITFLEARSQFPALQKIAYLNAGTFGPIGRTTAEAVQAELERDFADGRSGIPTRARRSWPFACQAIRQRSWRRSPRQERTFVRSPEPG